MTLAPMETPGDQDTTARRSLPDHRGERAIKQRLRTGQRCEDSSVRVPDVEYARSGGVAIAYQVVGDGPQDVFWIRGGINDMLSSWDRPEFVERMTKLTRFARVLLFDKRGTGLSDHVRDLTSLEARMDDVRAVMDAAGSSHAILTAYEEGARLALLYAATYPERVDALLLIDPYARMMRSNDHPWGRRPEDVRASVERVSRRWGDRDFAREMFERAYPDRTYDAEIEEWWVQHMRRGASPAAAATWSRGIMSADVTDILSSVRVPVVVVRVQTPKERVRYLTDRLADARIVDAEGAAVVPFGTAEELVLAELEALASGAAAAPVDRVLTTVLFTDIVDSTARATALGDRAWADLLERHHALVRRELALHRGKEVDTAGDGFFATFDGPGRAIRCAHALVEGVRPLGLQVRAGVHTGECEVAAGKVAGIAVVVGARVSPHLRSQGKSSRRARLRISSPVPTFRSRSEASTCLRGCPAAGGFSPSRRDRPAGWRLALLRGSCPTTSTSRRFVGASLRCWQRQKRPCITGASRGQHLTQIHAMPEGTESAWLSQISSSGEGSGLQACYGKSPGNGAFSMDPGSFGFSPPRFRHGVPGPSCPSLLRPIEDGPPREGHRPRRPG
jgi:pimeloyl-ACP methyl ester carboxylesterase